MNATLGKLREWMEDNEDEHLEFKEAKNHYDFEDLVKYCAAMANELGGKMILGVTNKRPRVVVGSQAFQNLERTKAGLTERLRLRFEIDEVQHPDGRALIFHIPSRPISMPIQYKGAYWMRAGEGLVPMTPDQLKRIFDEAGPDFSAEICSEASIDDLAPEAIRRFREMWRRKSGNEALDKVSDDQLLTDAELVTGDCITFAALILFGTRQALGRHLAQAEVIFEYRSSEASIPFQQRKEYRQGFFLFDDDLWNTINLRNDIQHYQDGLFVWDIPTFNETVIREAILNAVSHRDYRLGGSIFVRQFPRKIEIVSPGGFPPGITTENILWRQFPRNRRVAEIFAKCGFVERSGQGVNRMFEVCIKESKPRPDFRDTDDYQVSVTFHGEIQEPRFLRFLEQAGKETLASFTIQDLLVLDFLHRDETVPKEFKDRLTGLRERRIIEAIGHGRGTRYILSRRLYTFIGKKGVYTRKRGLNRETNKTLLLEHIEENKTVGSPLRELMQVLPALSRQQVQVLLRELRADGQIHSVGVTRGGRWYPGSPSSGIASNKDTEKQ